VIVRDGLLPFGASKFSQLVTIFMVARFVSDKTTSDNLRLT
jgi:hypothetical protein